ncbi:hypothetical protein ACLOJK_005136 [Asimina triloba]
MASGSYGREKGPAQPGPARPRPADGEIETIRWGGPPDKRHRPVALSSIHQLRDSDPQRNSDSVALRAPTQTLRLRKQEAGRPPGMLATGMNLITTAIGFGMSVTFIVFIFARLICGRIRAVDSRNATAAFQIDLRSEPEHIVSGLEPVAIAALPSIKFDKEAFHSREDTLCSICLAKHTISPVSNTAPQSMDSPDVVTDQSYQRLSPAHEPSSGNAGNQENRGSVARDLEYGSISGVQMR